MGCIDHLLRFADEPSAIAAVPQYRTPSSADSPADWQRDKCFACQVYTLNSDGSQTYLPYWYLWVALPAQDATLSAMAECMMVADRDAADRGASFVIQSAVPSDQLAQYFVTPVIHGSQYPFGVG